MNDREALERAASVVGNDELSARLESMAMRLDYVLVPWTRNMSEDERAEWVEKVWKDFWEPIFREQGWDGPGHTLDRNWSVFFKQLKLELWDYHNIMSSVSRAYDELSWGRISKPHTDATAVISVVNEIQREQTVRDVIETLEHRAEGMRPDDQMLIADLVDELRQDYGIVSEETI